MGSEEHVCPACGQPVETVVRRHKTLGAWVPLWVAGPCRNPDCTAHEAEDADVGHAGDAPRPDQTRAAEDPEKPLRKAPEPVESPDPGPAPTPRFESRPPGR